MAKILYPVGTKVQIRNWKVDELRGEGHTYDRRERTVKAYHRGEDLPYELEGVKLRFAVDEIKRYRGEDVATPAAPIVQPVGGVTADDLQEHLLEEVERIVGNQVNALAQAFDDRVQALHDHLLEDARSVAVEAIKQDQSSGA